MRSIAAILAGFVTTVVLAFGADFLLRILFPNQNESSPTLQAATLAYTSVFAGVGGFVTARIARVRPMRAVVILTTVAFVLSVLVLGWSGGDLPAWYKVASLVLLIPFTMGGGWLATRGGARAGR